MPMQCNARPMGLAWPPHLQAQLSSKFPYSALPYRERNPAALAAHHLTWRARAYTFLTWNTRPLRIQLMIQLPYLGATITMARIRIRTASGHMHGAMRCCSQGRCNGAPASWPVADPEKSGSGLAALCSGSGCHLYFQHATEMATDFGSIGLYRNEAKNA